MKVDKANRTITFQGSDPPEKWKEWVEAGWEIDCWGEMEDEWVPRSDRDWET